MGESNDSKSPVTRNARTMVYVADIPKVPKDQFEAVIKALLNTPPMPLADIPRKRERPNAKTRSTTKSKSK
jgi:hypothetical protein